MTTSPEWYAGLAALLGREVDEFMWSTWLEMWRLIGLWEDPSNPHGRHGTFAKDSPFFWGDT